MMTRQDLKEKRIGVLMGGLSAEREVSLRTGRAVANALRLSGYEAIEIDAGRDLPEVLTKEKVDVAFLALHGRYGEDGAVQGMLEMMGIPYTGSGVLASALAMDKVTAKKVLGFHGVRTPDFALFREGDDPQALLERISLPFVAKPSREGSTIGISIVRKLEELEKGLQEALQCDTKVLVEEYVEGIEVTVGVLDGNALPIVQVVPKGGFYDFHAKYTKGETEYLVPAPLDEDLADKIKRAAEVAFDALECSGAARVDFIIRGDELHCLEVNTIPGMTETSLLPKAAVSVGIPFEELVQRILEGASLGK